MMKHLNKYILLAVVISILCVESFSQIKSGKILFERKTNLYKKFKSDDNIKKWIKESDKIKIDQFELLFNDTASIFRPVTDNNPEAYNWTTSKDWAYQNFNTLIIKSIKSVYGEKVKIEDSLFVRNWKITDSKRIICGFTCRKAIWEYSSKIRIYAWYCDEIPLSSGPENLNGLPGMVMGLATEDGGIIYFAKKIEYISPESSDFVLPKVKGKIYTTKEIIAEIRKRFGDDKWIDEIIESSFKYW